MLKRFNINKSKSFSLKYTSNHPTVIGLVDKLWEKLPVDKTKNVKLKKECLTNVFINLNSGYKNFKYIRYSRWKNHYAVLPKRYKPDYYTHSIMTGVIDGLESLRLIESIPGFINLKDKTKLRTAICAKRKFFNRLQLIKNNMIEDVKPLETIILRDRKSGFMLNYKDTNTTRKMRKDVVSYNELRQDTIFSMSNLTPSLITTNQEYFNQFSKNEFTENDTEIVLRSSYVNRIFNGSFRSAGRFYNGLESNASKDLRSRILINGNPTVEKDYSCLHINMLYNKNKLPLKGDAYNKVSKGDPELRKLYKLIALLSLNSTDRKSCIKALRNEIRDNDLGKLFTVLSDNNISTYLDKWNTAHPAIKNYLYSDVGIKLQYEDSQLAAGIINHFTEKGIAVLVIHDSFIIEKEHESELEQIMKDVYEKKYKFVPNVS